jgi:probable HAF family extracellular repeat protein
MTTRIIATLPRRGRTVRWSRRHRCTQAALALLVVALLSGLVEVPVASAVEAPREREIIDLGTLPGGRTSTANAINDHGHVVGDSETEDLVRHAFLWRRGRMIDLGTLGGSLDSSGAVDINNHGQIVGWSAGGGAFTVHAVLWSDGRIIDLGTLPGGLHSVATGINDRGEVVGRSGTADGTEHAFVWRRGSMIDLGALPGEDFSSAEGINDRGQVVGVSLNTNQRAVVWQGGMVSPLALPPGADYGFALDNNNRGSTVGVGGFSGSTAINRAVVWRDGVPRELGIADPSVSRAESINDDGQIVGFGQTTGAFLWERGVTISLPGLTDADCTTATDINEAGQVVGSSPTADCFAPLYHAVIWR